MEKKQYVMIGIAVALVIAVAAPFIASGNPDVLESAFFSIHGAIDFQGDEPTKMPPRPRRRGGRDHRERLLFDAAA